MTTTLRTSKPAMYSTYWDILQNYRNIQTEVADISESDITDYVLRQGELENFIIQADAMIDAYLSKEYGTRSALLATTPWATIPVVVPATATDTQRLLSVAVTSTGLDVGGNAILTAAFKLSFGSAIAFSCESSLEGSQGSGSISTYDVDTIAWVSGNIIRYTFNGSPSFSGLSIGDSITASSSGKASNDGTFTISKIDDDNDSIDVVNSSRTDATDDEASDSPCVVRIGTNASDFIPTNANFTIGSNAWSGTFATGDQVFFSIVDSHRLIWKISSELATAYALRAIFATQIPAAVADGFETAALDLLEQLADPESNLELGNGTTTTVNDTPLSIRYAVDPLGNDVSPYRTDITVSQDTYIM